MTIKQWHQVYAPVPARKIDKHHIVLNDTDPIMLDGMEVEEKQIKPGQFITGTLSLKYQFNPQHGCIGIIERGTIRIKK